MKPPSRYLKLTRKHVDRLRKVERDYHIRAFGEELARVNLDLTKEDRIRYLQRMRDHARRKGVRLERPPPYGLHDEEDSVG